MGKLGKHSYFKFFCRKKLEKLGKTMVLTILLQNSCVFPAFSDWSTSGQSGAWPPIDGKSFKKLEKLGKLSCFFDFHEKKLEKLGKLSYFTLFCRKKLEKLGKTIVLAFLCRNSCVYQLLVILMKPGLSVVQHLLSLMH